MADAKNRGARLGNTTNLDDAQRKGAISNASRADRKVQELADFMSGIPGFEKMTLKEKVDLLNRNGPMKLVSEKRGERRPWTLSSIRKPLKRAEAELEFRNELDREDMLKVPNWAWDTDPETEGASKSSTSVRAVEVDTDVPVEVAYQDHPGFGKF